MSSMLAHSETPLELELGSPEVLWVDRLRRGIWPRPFVFWAVVVYIGLFIIRPWEVLFPELGEMRFERISVIAIAVIVLLRRGFMVRFSAQNLTMLLLFVSIYASGVFAFDPELSAPEVTEFFGFTLIFFLIQKAVRSPYQLLFIIASYLTITTAYVFKSVWEYAFNNGAQYDMGVYRLGGIDFTYGHPNTIGTTMLCSLPFALYFYRIREQFCRTWPPRMQRIFALTVQAHVMLCVLGIMLTRSRSTAVGLVVFAAILAFRQRGFMRKLKWAIFAAVIFLVGFMVAPSDIQNRIRTLWDPTVETKENMKGATASADGRWEGFLAGVAIFERFPVTGVGIGNFADYRADYVDGVRLNAHNLPGELLGELGLFGTFAFSAFFLVHFATLKKLQKLGKEYESLMGDPLYWLLGIAYYDGMLLLLFTGLAGHTLQQYQWYFYSSFAITALYFVRQEVVSARMQASEAVLCEASPELA